MGFDQLADLFVRYGYWIVFAAIVLDNVGLPIPGELLVVALGAFARAGDLDLGVAFLVAAAGAMSGDSIGYWVGRLSGTRALRTYCRATHASAGCVDKVVDYYRRYGRATVVLGRFVVGIRAFLPPLAGAARMPYLHFVLFGGLGALLWSGLFALLGYTIGGQAARILESYRVTVLVVVGVLGTAFFVYRIVTIARARHREAIGAAGTGRDPLLTLDGPGPAA